MTWTPYLSNQHWFPIVHSYSSPMLILCPLSLEPDNDLCLWLLKWSFLKRTLVQDSDFLLFSSHFVLDTHEADQMSKLILLLSILSCYSKCNECYEHTSQVVRKSSSLSLHYMKIFNHLFPLFNLIHFVLLLFFYQSAHIFLSIPILHYFLFWTLKIVVKFSHLVMLAFFNCFGLLNILLFILLH